MSNGEENTIFKRTALVLGKNGCGKTNLLSVFKSGVYFDAYNPSKPCLHPNLLSKQLVVDDSSHQEKLSQFKVEEQRVDFTLRDTNGEEEEDVLNALLHEAHVVMLCFAVDDPGSLEEVRAKWSPRIKESGSTVPTIVVACKVDLRKDPQVIERLRKTDQRPVPKFEGIAISLKLQPPPKFYVECSSKNDYGITDVLSVAAKACITELTTERRRIAKWRETKKKLVKALAMVLLWALAYYYLAYKLGGRGSPQNEGSVVKSGLRFAHCWIVRNSTICQQ
ncbi:hypothetical protein VNI00_008575 [Paramarasmius palmivorus]|uniref:Rho GTPase n=1 Tax=Paramarasmius palmivorus TaxID=297713 RepID=A0AAW0CTH9_9AGAR